MRRSIDFHSPEPADVVVSSDGDDTPPVSWVVAISDDYEDAEPRVVVTIEEMGRAGLGLSAHLPPPVARRLRAAIRNALLEVGEDPGP
ncbi:MAG TPA: hypothetical protein VGQ20_08655 [Acidimicrobiales bacterium]|jgi:hypothetical protein|nr:hypothetical protein [Acidimicrobiales bacterium]